MFDVVGYDLLRAWCWGDDVDVAGVDDDDAQGLREVVRSHASCAARRRTQEIDTST